MGGGREIALAAPPPPFNNLESWGEGLSGGPALVALRACL